jgi:prevent-host-death family protein
MREIQASDAKAHLSRLLDDIERGETIIITRHGRAIARIIPEAHRRQREIGEALADIKELGKEIGRNHGRSASKRSSPRSTKGMSIEGHKS